MDNGEEERLRTEEEETKSAIERAQQQKDKNRAEIRKATAEQQKMQHLRHDVRQAFQQRKKAENRIAHKKQKLQELKAKIAQVNTDRDIAASIEKIAGVQRKYCMLLG